MKNRFLESRSTLFSAFVMSFSLAACSGKLTVKSGESPEVKPQDSEQPSDAPIAELPKTFAESIQAIRVDRGLKSGTFGIAIDLSGQNGSSALTYLTTEKTSFADKTDPNFGTAKILDDGLARLLGLSGTLICEDGPNCSDFSLELKRKNSSPQAKMPEENAKVVGRSWWKTIKNTETDITVDSNSWNLEEDSPLEFKLVHDIFYFTKALSGLPEAFEFPTPDQQLKNIRLTQMKVENGSILFRLERSSVFNKGYSVKADKILDPLNVIKEVTYELLGKSDTSITMAYLNYTLKGLNIERQKSLRNYTTTIDGIYSFELGEDSSPEKLKAIPKLTLSSEKAGGSLSIQFEDTEGAKRHLTYPAQ